MAWVEIVTLTTAVVSAIATLAGAIIAYFQFVATRNVAPSLVAEPHPLEEFWTASSREGLFRPESDSGVLVVYVHGLNGDSKETWGELPRWIEKQSGLRVGCASFAYDTSLFRQCNIASIAEEFSAFLEVASKDYDDVILITHSLGGLVVRQSLLEQLMRLATGKADLTDPVSMRIRRIYHFGVPFFGGVPYLSIPVALAALIFLLPMAAVLHIASLFRAQGRSGFNLLPFQLMAWNPWLLSLNARWDKAKHNAIFRGAQFPNEQFAWGADDGFIPRIERGIKLGGTHANLKLPESPQDVVVQQLVDSLTEIASRNAVQYTEICRQSIVQTSRYDKRARVSDLIGAPTEFSSDSDVDDEGTQWQALLRLRTLCQENSRVILTSGPAGAGKSTVLRRLTKVLASDYLRIADSPIPLYINIAQLGRSNATTADELERQFLGLWSEMSQEFIRGRAESSKLSYLKKRIPDENLPFTSRVIILDGVDEYLSANPVVDAKTVHETAVRLCNTDDHPVVILGLRDSAALYYLAEKSDEWIRIAYPNRSLVSKTFPDAVEWLEKAPPHTRQVLLSPLFLSRLPQWSQRFSKSQDRFDLSEIFRATIVAMLHEKGLLNDDRYDFDQNDWINALGVITGRIAVDAGGELDLNNFEARFAIFKNQLSGWEHGASRDELERAVQLLELESAREALFLSTVYYASRPNRVRLLHTEWHSYLLGVYYSVALKAGKPIELGQKVANQETCIIVAENTREFNIDDNVLRTVFESDDLLEREPDYQVKATGNFVGLLCHFRSQIESSAISYLLSVLPKIDDGFIRHLLTSGVAYRVMKNLPDDSGRDHLKKNLEPLLLAGAEQNDVLLKSSCLCSLEVVYNNKRNRNAPLDFGHNNVVTEAKSICHVKEKMANWRENPITRQVQTSLLDLVSQTIWDSALCVVNTHYLMALLACRAEGFLYSDIQKALEKILDDGEVVRELRRFASENCNSLNQPLGVVERLDKEWKTLAN